MATTLQYDITRTDHEAVEQFIERLAAFGQDEWLCVARLCGDENGQPHAAIEALIAHHKLGVDAWSVADDVETAVHYSLGSRGFSPSREGTAFRRARQAATTAALALLIRPLLGATEFAALYRPFASLIPAAVPTYRDVNERRTPVTRVAHIPRGDASFASVNWT